MLKPKMSKLVLSFSLCLFLFCISINSVYAKNKVTETIDLTTLTTNEDKLEEEGWSWNNDTKTLVLDGVTIEITDENTGRPNECIRFYKKDDITIIFKGKNNLIADRGYALYGQSLSGSGNNGTLTLKGDENAVLNLSYKRYTVVGGGTNNGMTMGHPANLVMESGTVNSKGTIMIDYIFAMNGGSFNVDGWDIDSDNAGIYVIDQVKVNGGNLNVKSKNVAIRVPGTKSESDLADGVIINNGNVSLVSKEEQAIHTGQSSSTPEGKYTKNVVINGGNITLGGEDGIHVSKGSIIVNKVNSSDVSNVRKNVLKVDNM